MAAPHTCHVTISPDMRVHVEGYGDITDDVARELALMRHAELDELAAGAAQARQMHIAKETGAETHGFQHGRGLVGQVDAHIVAAWEARYGRAFWTDKSNRAEFFRKHPVCAVKYIRKPTIRGFRIEGRPTTRDDRLTLKTA
jgi:hypothetical protein